MSTAALTPQQLRHFGLTMAVIVAVLFGLLLPWILSHAWPLWPWIVAGVLGGLGLAYPAALAPFYRLWMKFGHVMGLINSRILLGLFFYLLITPVGLLMRLFGWDPMRCKAGRADSYRVVSQAKDQRHFERPF